MALSYALSTYAHLQAWLQREVDVVLAEELIDAATVQIEKSIGRVFVARTVTGERHGVDANQKRLWLDYGPIASVSSIADDQATPATVSASDYEVESHYLEHHGYWPTPTYKWNVTYSAGDIASTAVVPNNLRLAAHRLVAHYLAAPQGPIISDSRADRSTSYATPADDLPPDVMQLVAQYRRIGV